MNVRGALRTSISRMAALALALGVVMVGGAGPASHAACPEVGKVYYSVKPTGVYKGDKSTRTYGQAGGTISIALGESVTTGGSITGTTSAEAGVIFAQASVSVGVTIKRDATSSVTRSYSWKVPKNQKTGWVEAGHRAYSIAYTKRTIVAPCNVKTLKSGKIVGSTKNVQFNHS